MSVLTWLTPASSGWKETCGPPPNYAKCPCISNSNGVKRSSASSRAWSSAPIPVGEALELEWREAQLGQLARLVIGSDPGWRGGLTRNLRLDVTADAAQVHARLRA